MKIKKMFFLAIYYGFAYYLPATNANWLGRIGGDSQLVFSSHSKEMRSTY